LASLAVSGFNVFVLALFLALALTSTTPDSAPQPSNGIPEASSSRATGSNSAIKLSCRCSNIVHHGQLWNFVRGRPLKKGEKKEALKIKVQMTRTGPKNAIQKTRKGKGTEKATLGKR